MSDDTHVADSIGTRMHDDFRVLAEAMSAAVLGQQRLVERLLIALLADGHLLVEGAPGLAKTTAVKARASRTAAAFQRVQRSEEEGVGKEGDRKGESRWGAD